MKFEYPGQIYIDNNTGKKTLAIITKDQMLLDIQRYDDGDRVIIKIETFYRKRTKNQNDALHWYCQVIADHTGHSKDEIKEMIKTKFLKVPMTDANGSDVVDIGTGEVEQIVRETRSLNTVEFMEFMANIREWSLRVLNVDLPEPDKNWKLNLK